MKLFERCFFVFQKLYVSFAPERKANNFMNRQIFENIRRLKRELIPNERLILFGSQARGDARSDSDWDLLLLLKDKADKKEYEDKIYDMVLMGSKYNTYLSIKAYTEKEWEMRKSSPFYKNVERDKIEII